MAIHRIDGTEISPNNMHELGFKSNWTNEANENDGVFQLDVDKLTFSGQAKKQLQQITDQNGLLTGIPYEIELEGAPKLQLYIDAYEDAEFSDYSTTVKLKKYKGFDSLMDRLNDSTFDSLVARGVKFNYVTTKYVVIPDDKVTRGVTLSFMLVSISITIANQTSATITATAQVVNFAIPIPGLSAAGPVISSDVGAIVYASLNLAQEIAKLVILIIQFKKLATELKEIVFPKVREFKACEARELLTKSLAFFGYSLKSTLLDSLPNLVIQPVPINKERNKGFKSFLDNLDNQLNFAFTNGHPSSMDSVDTPKALFDALATMFNAKYRANNGLVRFERWDAFKDYSTVSINSTFNDQADLENNYQVNYFDAWRKHIIRYRIDSTDKYTQDNYDGAVDERMQVNTSITDKSLDLIKGLREKSIPFALAYRKEKLTRLENIVKTVFKLIDNVAGTSLSSGIEDRKGVMTITDQMFMDTKILYSVNGKQTPDYLSKIGAKALWENYHYINQINLNQWRIYKDCPLPMNNEIFVNLQENNWCKIDDLDSEILELKYIENDSQATVTYKKPVKWLKNEIKCIEVNG